MANGDLNNALVLEPLIESTMTFEKFLMELKGNEDRVGTAPVVILNAIRALGQEDPKEESNAERRRFLEVLQKIGIPSWKAFYHVCGSQLFANKLMKRYLEPAAAGGAQLKKMLIVEGGPAAGKDYFKDGIERALDSVAKVYAVKGCPDHGNPLNLLKLLPAEQLAKVAEATGFTIEELEKLMLTAGSPSQESYEMVMGSIENPKEAPNLAEVMIEKISISTRSTGVFEWKPGQECSLVAALRRSNRGFISMPDAFLKREVKPGETDERLILLDVTQYRRLPGKCQGGDNPVADSPYDGVILATTNKRAFADFLKTLPDLDAFTGRAVQLKLPYNLVLVEEIRAYETEMKRYEEVAKFGPLALRMIATLAVLSRYAVPAKDSKFIHPIARMRLLQGEDVKVKPLGSTDWDEIWKGDTADSGGGIPSGGLAGVESARRGTASPATAKAVPDNVTITPELMWSLVGSDEGLIGLDMRFMMSLLSRLNQYGLAQASEKKSKGDSSVTALEAIALLRQAIFTALMDTSNLTEDQVQVLSRCQKWLGGRPQVSGATWTQEAAIKPGLIESEYRRLLKGQILQAFSPDYESRAQEMFEDYLLHAIAQAQGKKDVKHPKHKLIPVDDDMLDDIDRYRLGKTKFASLSEDDLKFRRSLQGELSDRKDAFMALACQDAELEPDCQEARELRIKLAKEYTPTWETIPDLAIAIRTKLDAEIGELVQKLLKTEVVSDLDKNELARLRGAEDYLTKIGYSDKSRAKVLEYAKKVEVWKHQS